MTHDTTRSSDKVTGIAHRKADPSSPVAVTGKWRFVGRRVDGSVKWVEDVDNLVVDEGLNDMADVYFHSATATAEASWFVGLTTGTNTPAAGDTMASHAGWTEWTTYDEAARQAWGHAAPTVKIVTNSTPLTYTSSSDTQTVGGGFLTSVTTKGGSTGKLFNMAAFASNKSLDTGETVDVTVTITMSSS